MTFDPCLLVMQPRRIPRALRAIYALDIDSVWLSFMTESELVDVIPEIVSRTSYSHYVLLADDTVPTQGALDLVLEYARSRPVVTGYCNLVVGSPFVNLTYRPFSERVPKADDYAWLSRSEADTYRLPLVPTYFAGACLTAMTRELWERFPFRVCRTEHDDRGWASDWNLSKRLYDANVPIVAPRGAFVEHLKDTSSPLAPESELLVYRRPPEVRWRKRVPGKEKRAETTYRLARRIDTSNLASG